MKTIIISIFLIFSSLFTYSQSVGDYQSKTSGDWNSIATWQIFDGSNFIDATAFPTSTDGQITIKNGHTINIVAAITIDQVVVEFGGTLNQSANITLSNGVNDDLTLNGTWNWRNDIGNSTRNGLIVVGNTGIINIPPNNLNASLRINLTNNGIINWNGSNITITGSFSSPLPVTITNNGTFNISGAGILGDQFAPSNSQIINNGTINKNNANNPNTSNPTIFYTGGTLTNNSTYNLDGHLEIRGGRLNNNNSLIINNFFSCRFMNATLENRVGSAISGNGTIYLSQGILDVITTNLNLQNTIVLLLQNSSVNISSGRTLTINKALGLSLIGNNTIAGSGTLTISNTGGISGSSNPSLNATVSNFNPNGTIEPPINGSTTSSLTINTQQPLSANSVLNIKITSALGVGKGHGQLARAGNLTLSGTLTVTEIGSAPAGTYTIVNLTSGTISGSFSTVNLPLGYSMQVNSTSITITKASGPCDSSILLQSPTDDITSNSITKQTNDMITASNKIIGASNVIYRSNKSITLTSDTNGFFVGNGAVFKAEIGGCQ